MSDPAKPHLRVVQPGEAPAPEIPTATPIPLPPAPTWTAISPKSISERASFDYLVQIVDTQSSLSARRLAASGSTLVAGAFDIRRRAAEARPGAFLRNVTPGEKSVEALGVILGTHVAEATAGAQREAELRRAVLDASAEVVQAVDVAALVGIDEALRARTLFRSATSLISGVVKPLPLPSPYLYLVGMNKISVQGVEEKPVEKKDRTLVIALVAGLVGGLVVALALS